MPTNPDSDEVDEIVTAWIRERPDIDFAPLGVLSRVFRLARRLNIARKQAFQAAELEPWEWDVLSALRRAGAPYELNPKELLAQNLVTSGTMSNRIARLEKRGLISRQVDPNDRRNIPVKLTKAGLAQVDIAVEHLMRHEQELLAGMNDAELQELAGLLRKLSLHF